MFSLRISWNWLEASHGKGPCDGMGGALKGLADRVMKLTGGIQTAAEFGEQISPERKNQASPDVSPGGTQVCTAGQGMDISLGIQLNGVPPSNGIPGPTLSP